MKLEFRSNQDFWAGLMFIGIGVSAMFIARSYEFGSALHMGPGFFPIALGGILIFLGGCIMALGLRSNKKIQERLSIRALILLPLSLVLYGKLMELAGFIPAIVVLILASAASGREFKISEALLLVIALTVATAFLFIGALGLPYPLIKGF